ncbi:TIGR04222 domain-containing membrane protein [Streptomyces sp. NPDC048389]|uniref:TIGR04222 domain-containing membrane protein n=1 Tax=Streptomyces sp. NPDC048389 TaxID=3154622 RepID=UPI00345481F1
MTLLAWAVYLAVGVSSVLLIVRVSAARPAARTAGAQVHDVYEAAFLAGGPARVVDTALAALHADGRLAVGGPGIVSVLRPTARDPVERAVFAELASAPNGAWDTVRRRAMLGSAVQEVGDVLATRGLMVPPSPPGVTRLVSWGLAQTVLCVIGVPASIIVTVIESVSDPFVDHSTPFVFLVFPALAAGAVIGGLLAGRARRRVTRAGLRALRSYRAERPRPQTPADAVALNGWRGVPDPVLRAALTASARSRTAPAGHGGSSSESFHLVGEPVWCAGSAPGSGGCGSSGGGSGCGGSGGSGSSCGGGSSGSSCGGGSSGSSCGGGS